MRILREGPRMRVVRVITGTLLVVIALPMLVTGGALWGATQHRGAAGFSARVMPLATDGYALVAPQLDGLLRREAFFPRAGETTLTLSASGPQRLFLGIAPQGDVDRYLALRARTDLTRVRLAHGPLPVDVRPVPGPTPTPPVTAPGPDGVVPTASATVPPVGAPATLPIWMAASHRSGGRAVLRWSPS